MLRRTHALFAMSVAVFLRLTPSQVVASAFFGIISDMDHTLGLRHRGFTHSLLFAFLGFVATSALFPNLAIPVLTGITTHIFADMLNPEGVELFYPARRNYRILKLRFDSKLGNGLIVALSVFLVVLRLRGYSVDVGMLKAVVNFIHDQTLKLGLR